MKKKFLPKTAIFQLGIHEKNPKLFFISVMLWKKKYLKNSTKKLAREFFSLAVQKNNPMREKKV